MRPLVWIFALCFGVCLTPALMLTIHSRLGNRASAVVTVITCEASFFLRANRAMSALLLQQPVYAIAFTNVKHKLSVLLIVIVITIMGFIAATGEAAHLLFPSQPDKSRLYQSDRQFFERNLGKRRIFAVLPDVYRIDVIKLKNNQDWDLYYSGQQLSEPSSFLKGYTLTSTKNPQILKMFRQADDFHTEVLPHKNSQNIMIICWTEHDADAAPFSYVYIPESRRLGKNHGWCQMSTEFQRKMSEIIAHKIIAQ